MNQYEIFLKYLSTKINEIDKLIDETKEKNSIEKNIKKYLLEIINKIENKNISSINVDELKEQLLLIMTESKVIELINILNNILQMTPYIYQENIVSSLKNYILNDINNILQILTKISKNLGNLEIPEELNTNKENLLTIYNALDKDGFKRQLTQEESVQFYKILEESDLELSTVLSIIKDYLKYTLIQKSIHYNVDVINEVNDNLQEVMEELPKEEISEEISITDFALEEGNNPKEKEIIAKIKELLLANIHKINFESYEVYKGLYSNEDITKTLEDITTVAYLIGEIDFDQLFACIQNLLKYINTEYHDKIFEMLIKIINDYNEYLKQIELQNENQRIYKEKLATLKARVIEIINLINEYKSKLNPAWNKIEDNHVESIITCTENYPDADSLQDFLNHYNLNYNDVIIYKSLYNIIKNIKEISNIINQGINNETDLEMVLEEFDQVNEKLRQYISEYGDYQYDDKEYSEDEDSTQYEEGNCVVVFFRKNSDEQFLIEEDMNKNILHEEDSLEIGQILSDFSNMDEFKLNTASAHRDHFKGTVYENKPNGKKGPPVKISSIYDETKYTLYRFKANGRTLPRVTGIFINMHEANKRKFNIPLDKNVVLIIGLKMVESQNEKSSDYGRMAHQIYENKETLQKYIKLFEDPNTPFEVLAKILEDSNILYKQLVDNTWSKK